jgi:hypothetical protein
MINSFINYSKSLADSYIKGENPKKKILSEVFNEVSDILMCASVDLESDKFPEECCFKMKELTEFIIKETKNTKKDRHIIKLNQMLNNCNNLKERYEKNEIKSIICDLRKASTEFKALSLTMGF